MVYEYTAAAKKTEKVRIAKKLSKEFFGVEYDLIHLRKRDYDKIWSIANDIFDLTYSEPAEEGA